MKDITIIEKTIILHIVIAIIHSQLHLMLHVKGDIIDWLTAVPTSLVIPIVLLLFYLQSPHYLKVLRLISLIGMIHGTLKHLIFISDDNIINIPNTITGMIFKITVAMLLITQGALLAFSFDVKSNQSEQ